MMWLLPCLLSLLLPLLRLVLRPLSLLGWLMPVVNVCRSCGRLLTSLVSLLTVRRMWCVLFSVLMMSVSGCLTRPGATFLSEGGGSESLSRIPEAGLEIRAGGVVPVHRVVLTLVEQGLVRNFPLFPDTARETLTMVAEPGMRVADAINAVEKLYGWVYDTQTKSFYTATATHSVDAPDAFGRPTAADRARLDARSMVGISFRFVRISGGLASDGGGGASLGTTLTQFTGSLPDGVDGRWASTTERSYFEGIQSTASTVATTIDTQRKTVEAGIQLQALAARLPGGLCRIDGTLEISSFTGSNLDKAQVQFPLQIDGPRHEWIKTVSLRAGDLATQLAFKNWNISASGTAETVQLWVKVD